MNAAATLTVTDFDTVDADEAIELMLACARIGWWAEAVADGRPYGTREQLLSKADELAAVWSWEDVEGALAAHPRIGERPSGGGEAALSRAEQSGVDGSLTVELRVVNEAYEERFGRVLLVRAAGRSADDILRIALRRLRMDERSDRLAATKELRDIALRRLRGLIA